MTRMHAPRARNGSPVHRLKSHETWAEIARLTREANENRAPETWDDAMRRVGTVCFVCAGIIFAATLITGALTL